MKISHIEIIFPYETKALVKKLTLILSKSKITKTFFIFQKNGRYSIVSATVTNCTSRMNRFGLSPSAHLGDGCTDLILVEGSSRIKLLSYLVRTSLFGNAVSK